MLSRSMLTGFDRDIRRAFGTDAEPAAVGACSGLSQPAHNGGAAGAARVPCPSTSTVFREKTHCSSKHSTSQMPVTHGATRSCRTHMPRRCSIILCCRNRHLLCIIQLRCSGVWRNSDNYNAAGAGHCSVVRLMQEHGQLCATTTAFCFCDTSTDRQKRLCVASAGKEGPAAEADPSTQRQPAAAAHGDGAARSSGTRP